MKNIVALKTVALEPLTLGAVASRRALAKVVALCCLLLSVAACAESSREPQPEILGVRLGMSRDEARARLQGIGQLEKEERRQQEVWRLNGDASYSHLIVAYDKGYTAVRFVTAVASEQGRRVRYADVIDAARARADVTPATRTYTQQVPARDGRPAFVAKAIGSDPESLKYYSVEKID